MAGIVVAPSSIHGLGVFAARDFQAGETVLHIDDSHVIDEHHPLRPEAGECEMYCDFLAGGRIILMRAPERHINSCCDPNTFVRTIDGIRHVLARRRIQAGEEITYDYIVGCHGGEVWQCRCGSERCRSTIVSSFFDLPLSVQFEYLPLLDGWFVSEHEERVAALKRMRST